MLQVCECNKTVNTAEAGTVDESQFKSNRVRTAGSVEMSHDAAGNFVDTGQ